MTLADLQNVRCGQAFIETRILLCRQADLAQPVSGRNGSPLLRDFMAIQRRGKLEKLLNDPVHDF